MARILIIAGTRPEAIKLFPVVNVLARRPGLEPMLAITGQHRHLVRPVLRFAGLVAAHDLKLPRSASLAEARARLLQRLDPLLRAERPAAVIVQGDTLSALCGAEAAFLNRIPIAHVEAGLRSGAADDPFPEEAFRRMIMPLARWHFAPTAAAAAALRRERAPGTILRTGNTVIDALRWTEARLADAQALAGPVAPLIRALGERRLITVTLHRRESWGAPLVGMAGALAAITARGDCLVAVPLHPNPAVRAPLLAALGNGTRAELLEPLPYPAFVRLLLASHLILTDSGGVQEEACALGRPTLVLRQTTERPEAVRAGTARLIGTNPARIVGETARLLDDPAAHAAMARPSAVFGDGRAAARIAGVLARNLAS